MTGKQGPKGEDGQSVENITIEYYLSDSDSTPIGGTWTETKPSYIDGKYLWTRSKIAYKNPTKIEYTTPVLDDSWKAIEIAEEAKDDALKAVTTADGKNTVIFSTTEPSIEGRKIGDVWFDTSRDNLMHRFDGTQWVEAKWGEQSIVANSITANHIKSLVGLNVNDQFIVDSNGNVKFAGHLEGASGTFNGRITSVGYEAEIGSDAEVVIDEGAIEITAEGTDWLNHIRAFGMWVTEGDYSIEYRGEYIKFEPPERGRSGMFQIQEDGTFITNKLFEFPEGIYLSEASGINRGITFRDGHYISIHNDTLTIYGERLLSPPFKIRSHRLGSDFRDDFWIGEDGTIFSNPTYDNTSSNQPNVRIASVEGNYRFYRTTSSEKYKADVKSSDVNPYKLLDLEIKSWVDRKEYENNDNSTEGLKRIHGLIAEDLEKVGLHQFVDYINGEVENYDQRVFALLIPIVRDLLNEVKDLKQELETLKGVN